MYKENEASKNYEANLTYDADRATEQELLALQDAAGLTEKSMDMLKEEISSSNDKLKEDEDLVEEIAADYLQWDTNIGKVVDVLHDQNEALMTGEGTEYYSALEDLSKATTDLLGIEVGPEFVEKNLQLIQDAAAGSVEAITELQLLSAQEMTLDLNLPTDKLDNLLLEMEGINGYQMEVGASIDDTQFFIQLQEMVDNLEISTEDAQKILDRLGFDPDIEYEEVELSWAQNVEQNGFWGALKNKLTGNTKITIPRIVGAKAKGDVAPRKMASSSSNKTAEKGGSSGGSEKDPWENSLDKFYNTLEDINEELRIREKLEREFAKISEDGVGNSEQLLQNLYAQEAALKRQKKLQEQMLSGKTAELQKYLADNAGFGGYATYNWSDNTIEINWDEINKVTDADKGGDIEEYISGLEELQDAMDEASDSLADIEEDLKEINERGKDEYGKLEEQILDAYVNSLEKEIDELEKVYEAIEEVNSEMIEIMQNNLDEIRQDRENQKTEEQIGEDERRLAYLRQDTSGANALEILQLEKDLEEQKEDYTDTLIDQKISELERQNEIAAEQRNRQIELAREQVRWSKEQGMYWDEVELLLKKGITNKGVLIENSQLQKLLQDNQGYGAMSQFQKQSWNKDMANMIELADAWKKKNVGVGLNGKKTSTTSSSSSSKGTSTKSNPVTSKNTSGSGNYGSSSGGNGGSSSSNGSGYSKPISDPNVQKLQELLKIVYAPDLKVDGVYGDDTKKAVKKMQQHFNSLPSLNANLIEDGLYGKGTRDELSEYMSNIVGKKYEASKMNASTAGYYLYRVGVPAAVYKKGGLADFTGPAWLDGTKSHPELVLNAQDTKNFIQLKNVLSDLMSDNISDGNGGDNYYEIHIEVDEIANDYDVEKLASKVKKIIANDSMYRNVNAINMLR